MVHLNGGSTHLERDLAGVSVDALLDTTGRSVRDARAAADQLEARLNEAWQAVMHLQLVHQDAPAT
jgi:hypothetical protein